MLMIHVYLLFIVREIDSIGDDGDDIFGIPEHFVGESIEPLAT